MSELVHRYWSAHELVVIGVFAAAAKVSTLLVALAGGGMNPVSLLLKNLIYTTLLVVMLYRVRKAGTLLLFSLVSMLGERPAAGGQHHPAARHLAGRSDGRGICRPLRRLWSGMGPGVGRGRVRHCEQGLFAPGFPGCSCVKTLPCSWRLCRWSYWGIWGRRLVCSPGTTL